MIEKEDRLINKNNAFCKKSYLTVNGWISYDSKNYFKKIDNAFVEIIFKEELIDDNFDFEIEKKIIKVKEYNKNYIHVYDYKTGRLFKEFHGIEIGHEMDKYNTIIDKYCYHRDTTLPSFISYDINGHIETMRWFFLGKEYTEQVDELLKNIIIKTENDILETGLKKLIDINVLV